ncbi:MAG: hypothetical protein KME54_25065 [Tolypothrix brevis GSE-NOS-MK-07-07A]|nr:hypothetical protein [Tolypothrix brevis GSE-NOS-MK-07-07A]
MVFCYSRSVSGIGKCDRTPIRQVSQLTKEILRGKLNRAIGAIAYR